MVVIVTKDTNEPAPVGHHGAPTVSVLALFSVSRFIKIVHLSEPHCTRDVFLNLASRAARETATRQVHCLPAELEFAFLLASPALSEPWPNP